MIPCRLRTLSPRREVRMRRPHVYERSVPRVRRDAYRVPDADADEAVRAVLRALPNLIALAGAAGLQALVDRLDAVRREAERIDRAPEGRPP